MHTTILPAMKARELDLLLDFWLRVEGMGNIEINESLSQEEVIYDL